MDKTLSMPGKYNLSRGRLPSVALFVSTKGTGRETNIALQDSSVAFSVFTKGHVRISLNSATLRKIAFFSSTRDCGKCLRHGIEVVGMENFV
jgi:hypothetical protein